VVQNQDLYHNDKWMEVEERKGPANEEKRLWLSSFMKYDAIFKNVILYPTAIQVL
jgi:hypothetical protein